MPADDSGASALRSGSVAGVAPTTLRLIETLVSGAQVRATKKTEGPKVYLADPNSTDLEEVQPGKRRRRGKSDEPPSLTKSILGLLNGAHDSPERLAFEVDPSQAHAYASLFYSKARLLPDNVLKRISIQDDLVAAIVNTRSAQMQTFGRPQPDRFSTGFKVVPDPAVMDKLDQKSKDFVEQRVARAEKLLVTCGRTDGWKDSERMTLSQWLGMSARNAVVVGRIATERIYVTGASGKEEFHSFRPIDAGTIFKAAPQRSAAEAVRRDALHLLAQLKGKKEQALDINPEQFANDEFAYVQVVEGTPREVFHDKECVVRNFYPVCDVEMGGYPVTPLDTSIAAVTTHINITTHNRLYFQNGRAARGILVVRSDDVDLSMIKAMRHQFQASINNANNSWRLPVFGVGKEDEVEWQQIDVSARDMEFQYLSDTNARVIMSAFQISPEELPGYQHLCLSPDSQIWTEKGATTIGTLLGDEQEVGGFKVWTGTTWSPARAFWTGKRQVRRTKTGNGVTLTTSPEHRFRVVGNDGNLGWKQQDQLRIGDVVLINRNPVPGSDANVPSYRGRKLTPELTEVLGWLTGDGTITVRKKGKVHHSKELEFYYHHDKEVGIRERHSAALAAFGLDPKVVDRQVSEAAVERQKRICGFKSVASVKRMLKLYDTDFVAWLLDLGFRPASEGKAIPDFIHGLPVDYRSAFLRGFFSADGSKDKLDTPSITIAAEETREQTKKLLLNMGIRTRACEGTTKTSWFKKPGSDEYGRTRPSGPSKLIVKDKREFYERVGFLQPHKQPDLAALATSDCRWDKVARGVAVALADRILAASPKWMWRDAIRHDLKDPPYPFQARLKVQEIADRYKVELPSWTREFYQEPVVGLEIVDESVDMVDVEVLDVHHAFVADGVVVHNSRGTNSQALSEGNNEYKLEAARDVGIRPLIAQFEDFVNGEIFPLIDPTLAKFCVVQFLGLDADTPEKEITGLQEGMGVHMTYDDVLQKVEKKPVGAKYGGQLPLNPMFLQVLDRYLTVGEVLERFFEVKDAAQDPALAYRRDPFFFQWAEVQQAQAQAQQQAAQPQPGGGQQQPQSGSSGEQQAQQPGQDQQQEPDLATGIDQVIGLMSKSESKLPPSRQRLLALHRRAVDAEVEAMRRDLSGVENELVEIAERHAPRK